MNHGRLGYITRKGELRVPPAIIDQLGLRIRNVLFGVYYPPNSRDPAYRHATVKDDFMLTPLLPALWDRAGCFIVRINHEPGAFASVAEFFARNRLSIYWSECTRSAYRYDTWTLHAVVTDLPKKLAYIPKFSGYRETCSFLDTFRKKLTAKCKDLLFVDPREPDLEKPVKLLHLSALSYFAHYCRERHKGDLLYQPFTLQIGVDGCLADKTGGLAHVIHTIEQRFERSLKDSVVFVEVDRRNFNIRTPVFSPEQANHLFVVHSKYRTEGDWNTFRGLIARVAHHLPKTCTVWKCSSEKLTAEPDREQGVIKMIIEDPDSSIERGKKLERIRGSVIQKHSDFAPNTVIENVDVYPVTVAYCRRRIDRDFAARRWEGAHVFLSYPREQRRNATRLRTMLTRQGIEVWMDKDELRGGEEWEKRIRTALHSARELVLLWTPKCKGSEWIMMEWSIALFLEKPVTVMIVRGRADDLPAQLKKLQCISFADEKARRLTIVEIRRRMSSINITSSE